jgi:hypothetical protein
MLIASSWLLMATSGEASAPNGYSVASAPQAVGE